MDEMNTVGTLYIVATPIGNARDMTERGRQILETADIIAAEDTRRSVVLLNKLGIRGNQLSANHKFNEYGKARWFIEQLQQGKSIAVITDAGTPCISDPGNELIRAAIDAGIRVVGVPGCCAAVTALSISGFDLSTFFSFGFFPREAADRRRALAMMRAATRAPTAFTKAPSASWTRWSSFISEHAGVRLCLCNDMTKLHEMTFRGTPAEVRDQLLAKGSYDKGEYVLLCEVEEDYLITEVEHVSSADHGHSNCREGIASATSRRRADAGLLESAAACKTTRPDGGYGGAGETAAGPGRSLFRLKEGGMGSEDSPPTPTNCPAPNCC